MKRASTAKRLFKYGFVLVAGMCIPLLVQQVSSSSVDWRVWNLVPGGRHDPIHNLVDIPGGVFIMGSHEGGNPPHVESVSAFRMGRTELTAGAYRKFATEFDPGWVCGEHLNLPASGVSYDAAVAYCRWLSERSGHVVRLPTEVEWEYAARGGLEGARYPWGWGAPEKWAAFKVAGPEPVGQHPPNPWGLYDMAGNVYEWCARSNDKERACVRGGSWAEKDPSFLRVFHHVELPLDYRDLDVGFRIVVEQ